MKDKSRPVADVVSLPFKKTLKDLFSVGISS